MFRVYVMFLLPESTKIHLVVHRQFHMLINVSLKRSLGGHVIHVKITRQQNKLRFLTVMWA